MANHSPALTTEHFDRIVVAAYIAQQEHPESKVAQDLLLLCDRVKELETALNKTRRDHRYCEDCWYSCPKAEGGCCDDSQGTECNCGTDEHNAQLDKVLAHG